MKKHLILLLTLVTALCLGMGAANALTFTDDRGREVTVENPERGAALLASYAKVWQLAGGNVVATPHDAWDDLHLDLAPDTVNIGKVNSISLELLLSAKPDFILAGTAYKQPLEWEEMFASLGIPVAYFETDDFASYLRMLDILTQLTGDREAYARYGTDVQETIDETIAKGKERTVSNGSPKVLTMTAAANFVKAKNSGTVLGAILKDLGCVNIADSDTMLLENLSVERIVAEDPDYIFIVQRGDDTEGMRAYVRTTLEEDPLWQSLTAVKNGRFFIVDKELYGMKPNERWGEAYAVIEAILEGNEG
ncbi:MAG: ABC transporter substrate-binding protein [Clostridia bacterium]|nr:ABC transporter substrate-binding protein [Clostridia bacterium]